MLDSEIARTATIAAMPIAIPRPESAARSLRAERPTAPTRRTSRGASRSVRAPSCGPLRVELDDAVAKLDAPRQRLGELTLVRDHDHGRPRAIQRAEERDDALTGLRVEVPRRLVGEQDARSPDHRPRHGDPLALAAGQLVGPVAEAVREPDLVERLLGACPALAERQAGVEQAVGDVVGADRPSSRKNCWNTNPMARAEAPRASGRRARTPDARRS